MPLEPDPATLEGQRRPFSVGRSLVAFAAFSSPGLIAAAVVWPLLRDRWRPVAAIVLAAVTLLSLGLAGLVGWLDRRQLPGARPAADPNPGGEPSTNHRKDGG